METLNRVWRLFFAVALVSIAIQQFICSGFRPVIMPPEPAFIGQSTFCMCVSGIMLILVSATIVSGINSHIVADYLGAFMLIILVLFHIPYNIKTNLTVLYMWGDAFKLLAFCGGALIVATSIPAQKVTGLDAIMDRLRPFGPYFFATTMIVFGIEHFIYPQFVALLIPGWIPFHVFWTYFAGLALIVAGAAIMLKIKVKLAASLLGLALFLWLIMLHIPRALDTKIADRANEWTSVFEALGFSGIAFLIAGTYKPKETEASQ
ncbi:hypothetical protein [Mucilaginibacter sp. FT3.2]|uniref:hypothetical protein n=1 Tax=Mucilaginibacter sp. FT3.2 TaxID=2723090 RepID=UPI0016104989|nr:hypothetical protein [Mucilaginibacter sp. FT3.2]MBB6230796.1 putative membrane protein [Mucilaginibacter sp. FT3.2]